MTPHPVFSFLHHENFLLAFLPKNFLEYIPGIIIFTNVYTKEKPEYFIWSCICVIERKYTSFHFPWRKAKAKRRGGARICKTQGKTKKNIYIYPNNFSKVGNREILLLTDEISKKWLEYIEYLLLRRFVKYFPIRNQTWHKDFFFFPVSCARC